MKAKKSSIFSKVKEVVCVKNFKACRYVPKTLGRTEKAVLIALAVVIVISGIFVWRNYWLNSTHEAPAYGGTLIEGIAGESKDLDKHMSRLTGAGLTRQVENGDVKGDIAESWEVLDDGKTYLFKIRDGYSAGDLLNQIQSKNLWSTIEMAAPDDKTMTFKFSKPFSPFLYVSTEPIFNYGPYKITKEEKSKVTLEASDDYWQGTPNIEKIEIRLYSNHDALIKAAKSGEIMSYLKDGKEDYEISNSKVDEFTLPRELNLFFNLNKPELTHTDWRQNLRDGVAIPEEKNWVLVTSESEKNIEIANNLKAKWQPLKVNLEIKTYNNIELQKNIIPNREYDLLLYGQDYGPDTDPYPFWHSSQAKSDGANLSNFKNSVADKLLEKARQAFDFSVRSQNHDEFRKILNEQVPYINIEKTTLYYVVSNKVKGVGKLYGSSESDRFLNVSQWYINSQRVKN